MKIIKLGQVQNIQFKNHGAVIVTGETKITKETEKAILVEFIGKSEIWEYEYRDTNLANPNQVNYITALDEVLNDQQKIQKWIPKSACNVTDNQIEVEDWVIKSAIENMLVVTDDEEKYIFEADM